MGHILPTAHGPQPTERLWTVFFSLSSQSQTGKKGNNDNSQKESLHQQLLPRIHWGFTETLNSGHSLVCDSFSDYEDSELITR